jgi:heme-degrading monooxygenase HmoA
VIRVIYRFLVKQGQEQSFIKAWERETRGVRATIKGSKGGMLLRDSRDQHVFIAIMRWESQALLKAYWDLDLPESEPAKAMSAALTGAVTKQIVDELADLTSIT